MPRAQNSFSPEEIEVLDQMLIKASSNKTLGDLADQEGFSGAIRKVAKMKKSIERQKEDRDG